MYMLVRYTDETESAYAAVIAVAGHRPPLRWKENFKRSDAVWNEAGTRAVAKGTNENPEELVYFGIEEVRKIDGYQL